MFHPPQSPCVLHASTTRQKVQILKLIVIQFSPTLCSFLRLRSKRSLRPLLPSLRKACWLSPIDPPPPPSSSSTVAPLSKKDNHLSSCSPPSIRNLRYLSPNNNSNLSYVILQIIFSSNPGSPFKSFLV